MTAVEFCYWLQGYFELAGATATTMTAEQTDLVKRHLGLVFQHDIDPRATAELPAAQAAAIQQQLQQQHDGRPPATPMPSSGALVGGDKPGLLRC
jgi:hypothetical protein